MKLGVLTVALGDMSLDAACKFLSEQGVQMVESILIKRLQRNSMRI